MDTEIYNTFDEHEFFGEFFPNKEKYSARFSGKICYSPEKGLCLKYIIVDTDIPSKCEYLHGVLDNGKICTLIGPFDFTLSGKRLGKVSTKFGAYEFPFLILGDFFDEKDKFVNCRFTFHHMQEFFYPQGRINSVAYEDKVLDTISGDDWKIDVESQASGTNVTNNLVNVIMTDTEEARSELSLAFEKIKEKYPNELFFLRNSFKYVFNYQPKTTKLVEDINSEINKISSLFSIFMHNPTFPDEIKIYFGEDRKPASLLSSMHIESTTVDLAKKKRSHFFMPINKTHVDLSTALKKWFDIYDEFRVLSTTFQYETNFKTLHSSYSDVILYSTNIEAIANDLGIPRLERYEGPINKYSSEKLTMELKGIFLPLNSDSLGVNISNIRNELTHIGKPKNLMNKLGLNDYIAIGHLLRLVIVSHLLIQIGVSTESVHQYQDRLIN